MPIDPVDFSPWTFPDRADDEARAAQMALQAELAARGHRLGEQVFVSAEAALDVDSLALGDRSYIAAGTYLTGDLEVGADCSINPYTVLRGSVRMGDGVRIGAHTSILGFNHLMEPGEPVFRQPLVSRGIVIGDDVWIGSHVVILDGVRVGDHSVLAAGAVVTKDVADGAIVGGNPARLLRWRVPPATPPSSGSLAERLAGFADRARADALVVLDRAWDAKRGLFLDRPGAPPTVRAHCDAIEIADLLLRSAPPQLPVAEQVARLQGWQDPATGAVAALDASGAQGALRSFADPDVAYHVLSVGSALDLLGAWFPAPLAWVAEATPESVVAFLEGLPWSTDAWNAGHHVDGFGTALLYALRAGRPVAPGVVEALLGWLVTRADPATGMWGEAEAGGGLLLVVNGFYRASRGTFAQFGVPLPYPERVVDTVLRHAADPTVFGSGRWNACNVLDVAHPLWLTRGSGYRADEVQRLAEQLLDGVLAHWAPGFAFRLPSATTRGMAETEPGLQGTEMWLATIWYLADLLGVSDALGYRPRGVHRPSPAWSLRRSAQVAGR